MPQELFNNKKTLNHILQDLGKYLTFVHNLFIFRY